MLHTNTETAWCPEWYAILQAARYLGVAPWDLIKQSVVWTDWALIAMSAEHDAQKIIDDRKK